MLRLADYIERHLSAGGRLNSITRHVLGLYHEQPGARAFRRRLSGPEIAGAGLEQLQRALAEVERLPDHHQDKAAA